MRSTYWECFMMYGKILSFFHAVSEMRRYELSEGVHGEGHRLNGLFERENSKDALLSMTRGICLFSLKGIVM